MWNEQNADIRSSAEKLEAHCGKADCRCVHASGCYRGWVDSASDDKTSPCPICREDLARVLSEVGPLGQRSFGDSSKIQNRGRVHYA